MTPKFDNLASLLMEDDPNWDDILGDIDWDKRERDAEARHAERKRKNARARELRHIRDQKRIAKYRAQDRERQDIEQFGREIQHEEEQNILNDS